MLEVRLKFRWKVRWKVRWDVCGKLGGKLDWKVTNQQSKKMVTLCIWIILSDQLDKVGGWFVWLPWKCVKMSFNVCYCIGDQTIELSGGQ
jgi:hypothetical protein